MNIGKTAMRVSVNGRQVEIEPGPEPVGFDFRPAPRTRPLPIGQRPCA